MAKNQVVLRHITRISPPPPPSIYGLQNFICIALWLVLNAEFYGLHQWNLKAVKRERKKKVTSKLCTLLVRCRSVTRHIQSVHKISLFVFAVSLNVFFMNVWSQLLLVLLLGKSVILVAYLTWHLGIKVAAELLKGNLMHGEHVVFPYVTCFMLGGGLPCIRTSQCKSIGQGKQHSPVLGSTAACACRVSCWLAYSELPPALLSSAFALVRYEDMACSSLLIWSKMPLCCAH